KIRKPGDRNWRRKRRNGESGNRRLPRPGSPIHYSRWLLLAPEFLFPFTRYAPRFTPYEGFMVLTNQERSRSLVCHEKKCRCRGCYRNCGPAIFSGPAESSVV